MRPEHAKIVGKYPILGKIVLALMVIAFVAGVVELVFDPNPIENEEKDNNTSSGYYDGFDRM